ncbi:MAG: YczE/YyaS/YitT family protein [Turicibacter sp.]
MQNFKRIIIFNLGIITLALGAVLLSKTGIGISSWDAVNFGLSGLFGLTVGTWVSISSFIVLIFAAILQKKSINFVSFIIGIITGLFIDLWISILEPISFNTLLTQYLFFIIGVLTLSLGIGLYLLPKYSPGPVDYLMVVIKEKYHLKIMYAKLMIDFSLIFIAFLCKGPIGIGTIIIALLLGPCIASWQNILTRFFPSLVFDEL